MHADCFKVGRGAEARLRSIASIYLHLRSNSVLPPGRCCGPGVARVVIDFSPAQVKDLDLALWV